MSLEDLVVMAGARLVARDDHGALLRQLRVELEKRRTRHGVVDESLVPEEGREHGPETLGHGGA